MVMPTACSTMASVSMKVLPVRCDSSCPTVVLPEVGMPMSTMFSICRRTV